MGFSASTRCKRERRVHARGLCRPCYQHLWLSRPETLRGYSAERWVEQEPGAAVAGAGGSMLGALIRAARKARGWTQSDLASQVGVGWKTIASIERGGLAGRNPQLARRLTELLDLERDPP